jgi:hypothetical protein
MIHFVKRAYTSAVVIYSTRVSFMINEYVMNNSSVVLGMLYDLALLVLTIIGLLRMPIMPSTSTLWRTLVKQGVIYFILNFVANLILLVCSLLLYRVVAD